MKLAKTIALWVICLLLGSAAVSAFASEGTDLMNGVLRAKSVESAEVYDTAILFNALTFSIPDGWEKTAEEELQEGVGFQYRCTDKDGVTAVFEGTATDTARYFGQSINAYGDIKEKLENEKTDHIIARFHGIEMIAAGDDSLVLCICLTQDGMMLGFGFGSETGSMADVAQSEKLAGDIAAIIHSIKALPGANLLPFEDAIWGDPAPTQTPAGDQSNADKDGDVQFFMAITDASQAPVSTHPIYLGDQLVLSIPDDWVTVDPEDSVCAFRGTDEAGNTAVVVVDAIKQEGITLEALAEDAKSMRCCCTITSNGRTYFTVLAGNATVISAWLAEDDCVLMIAAYTESAEAMQSEKLLADLHQILCRLRPLFEGETEQLAAQEALKEQADKGEAVSFQDPEFERMVRAAMGRTDEEPIYAAELEAIRNLSIRTGKLLFSQEIIMAEAYRQPCALDLADLALFPGLRYLSVTDMKCTGFEALTKLPELHKITLIRTGLTDCGFVSGMSITELNLAGNILTDFSPIASLTGLRELNLSSTGLVSLDILRGLDLTELVVANNSISDLEPIADMTNLTNLYIQNTKVESLEVLRSFKELVLLNISEMPGEISLEPLHELENLQHLLSFGTSTIDANEE